MDLQALFDRSIPEPNTGCWIWMNALDAGGYGRVTGGGYAHRRSYEASHGKIPDGLEIDHLCRVRCCINPEHLEPVTPLENQIRSIRARIREGLVRSDPSRCLHGHDLSIVGSYQRKNKLSSTCMECARISRRRYDQAKRNAA